MATAKSKAATIALAELPAVAQPLRDGAFIGLTTLPDGTHHAMILLADRPAKRVTWAQARAWAKKAGGQLPTRPQAALIFANARNLAEPRWHWTSETEGDSYAWYCYFGSGTQDYLIRSFKGSAVAVRLIPLNA